MPSNSLPIIVALNHEVEYVEAAKREIDALAREGITRIGIEKSVSILPELEQFARQSQLNPAFRSALNALIKNLEPASFVMDDLAQYAQAKGLQVMWLEGQIRSQTNVKSALERLEQKWPVGPVASEKEAGYRLYKQLYRETEKRFLGRFSTVNLKTDQMRSRIQKQHLPAVIVGYEHAAILARQLNIPAKNLRWVGVQRWKRPLVRLKTRYQYAANQWKRNRLQAQLKRTRIVK